MAEVEFHIGICQWVCYQQDCNNNGPGGMRVRTRYTTKPKATVLALAHAKSSHFGELDLATPQECLAMGQFSPVFSQLVIQSTTGPLMYWNPLWPS